jgi:exonuclease VII large subunit
MFEEDEVRAPLSAFEDTIIPDEDNMDFMIASLMTNNPELSFEDAINIIVSEIELKSKKAHEMEQNRKAMKLQQELQNREFQRNEEKARLLQIAKMEKEKKNEELNKLMNQKLRHFNPPDYIIQAFALFKEKGKQTIISCDKYNELTEYLSKVRFYKNQKENETAEELIKDLFETEIEIDEIEYYSEDEE